MAKSERADMYSSTKLKIYPAFVMVHTFMCPYCDPGVLEKKLDQFKD